MRGTASSTTWKRNARAMQAARSSAALMPGSLPASPRSGEVERAARSVRPSRGADGAAPRPGPGVPGPEEFPYRLPPLVYAGRDRAMVEPDDEDLLIAYVRRALELLEDGQRLDARALCAVHPHLAAPVLEAV